MLFGRERYFSRQDRKSYSEPTAIYRHGEPENDALLYALTTDLEAIIMTYITMLKAKLHRVKVTALELEYEGSCAIDSALLASVGIRPLEQIHIYNVNNGERFVTYAIEAPKDSKVISLNGAAARLAALGDILIIATYAQVPEEKADEYKARVAHVDENNRIITTA